MIRRREKIMSSLITTIRIVREKRFSSKKSLATRSNEAERDAIEIINSENYGEGVAYTREV